MAGAIQEAACCPVEACCLVAFVEAVAYHQEGAGQEAFLPVGHLEAFSLVACCLEDATGLVACYQGAYCPVGPASAACFVATVGWAVVVAAAF